MELIIILVIGVAAMWFMSSRARKQQREAVSFRDSLQPGQEVMTGSGLFGTVVSVEGDVVTLESTPGNETRWLKAAIAKLVDPPVEEDDQVEDSDADEFAATGTTTVEEGTTIEPFGDEDGTKQPKNY
ncbi:preprotein translocase subunit YajC [Cellulomonas sp. NPDC089187]|uniref:preprotein translocase subunit YajC n=1 Tax=Cellulomonas sp. NPDC089187 TaxID=3154970 RepID=UPI00341990DA